MSADFVSRRIFCSHHVARNWVCVVTLVVFLCSTVVCLADVAPRSTRRDSLKSAAEPLAKDGRDKTADEKRPEGRLYWGDVYFFRDWHIQQNVATRGYRLLGPDDQLVVSGTFEVCKEHLDAIRRERKLPEMKGEAVILVHGLIRSFSRMLAAREYLQKAGYQNVFIFDYASTEVDIPTAAESLHRAMQSLEGIEKVHFVAHSMGGIVVREYLAKYPEPRMGRLVMLGTPNQGAELSDRFGKSPVFRFVFGPAALQLASPVNALSKAEAARSTKTIPAAAPFLADLPVPKCEFALIAGCRGNAEGYNPLIPGDDDGIVSLASTRLVGAKDSLTVQCKHSRLTRDPVVLEYVVRFLKEGRLRKEGAPVPILADPPEPSPASDPSPNPRQRDGVR